MQKIQRDMKKVGRSIALSDRECEMVDKWAANGGFVGESFSSRLSWVLADYSKKADVLVVYQSEEQMEEGQPVVLDNNAQRIFAAAPFLKGWTHKDTSYADVVKECMEQLGVKAGKSYPQVHGVVEMLRAKGYRVQEIQAVDKDFVDIWMAARQGAEDCGDCKADLKRQIEEVLK